MFWNEKINLTAYTVSDHFTQGCPPLFKKSQTPSFLKKLKNISLPPDPVSGISIPVGDVRTCPGIRDYLTEGITITMWEDTIIKIHPSGNFTYAVPPGRNSLGVGGHSPLQWGELYPSDRVSVKLLSPWLLKADRPAKFLLTESHYSTNIFRENNIWVPPGVVDFHKQRSTNIHLIFPRYDEEYEVFIKYGTPLVTLFPMTDKEINFNVKTVPQTEYNNLNILPSTFRARYFKTND